MLRWLKDRKKVKRRGTGKDEYGFKGKGDYGFDDKMYHIYEEIPDLPESSGPYMVVPLDIGDKKIKGKKVSFQGVSDASEDFGTCQQDFKTLDLVDSVRSTTSSLNSKSNRNVPVMGIGQKTSMRGGEVTCALVGRKNKYISNAPRSNAHIKSKAPVLPARNYMKKSFSAKSMENMSESKLKSRRLLENILSDLSKSSDNIFNNHDTSSDTTERISASNSVDEVSEKRVNNLSIDSNDTGCEYDMSTSGESDKSSQDSYDYYLHQVEQNFTLRCRVHELTKYNISAPRHGGAHTEEDSDSDSFTTLSTVSQVTVDQEQKRQSPTCSSDEGTVADMSESENSSGYYDSCSVNKKDTKPVIKLTSAILQQKSTQRTRPSRHKMYPIKDKKFSAPQPKPKSKPSILEEICEKYDSISESGSSYMYARRTLSEVYSPPPAPATRLVNQSFKNSSGQGSMSDRAQIYQTGVSHNNNNRLLSDLIMMNYCRQGHQF